MQVLFELGQKGINEFGTTGGYQKMVVDK